MVDDKKISDPPENNTHSESQPVEVQVTEHSIYSSTPTVISQSSPQKVASRIVSSLITKASVTSSRRQAEITQVESPLRIATTETRVQSESIAYNITPREEPHPTSAAVDAREASKDMKATKTSFLFKAKNMMKTLFRRSSLSTVVTENPLPIAKTREKKLLEGYKIIADLQ